MKGFLSFIFAIILLAVIGFSAYYIFVDDKEESDIHPDIIYDETEQPEVETPSEFSVVYNGEVLSGDKSYVFQSRLNHSFQIEYNANCTEKGYTVKVVPNILVGFTVNGTATILETSTDLTNCFNIDCQENSFTLNIPESENLKTILQKVYPTKSININSSYRNSSMAFYRLVVFNSSGKEYYVANFGIGPCVNQIVLPGELVF